MESAEIIGDVWLRREQILTLLDISESTLRRWERSNCMPRAAWLVLRSVAQGLPVLPSRSDQWHGHRFGPNGALYTPTGYPIYPADLWLFEFLMINGEISQAKRRRWSRSRVAANDV